MSQSIALFANTVVLPNRVTKRSLSKFEVLNIVIILHIIEREGSEFCLLCSLSLPQYEKSVLPLASVMIYNFKSKYWQPSNILHIVTGLMPTRRCRDQEDAHQLVLTLINHLEIEMGSHEAASRYQFTLYSIKKYAEVSQELQWMH